MATVIKCDICEQLFAPAGTYTSCLHIGNNREQVLQEITESMPMIDLCGDCVCQLLDISKLPHRVTGFLPQSKRTIITIFRKAIESTREPPGQQVKVSPSRVT